MSARSKVFRDLNRAAKSVGCTWHMEWRTSHRPAHFAAVLVGPHGPVASRIAESAEIAASRMIESIDETQANYAPCARWNVSL